MIQCRIFPSGQGEVFVEDYLYFYVFTKVGVECKGYYLGPMNTVKWDFWYA